MSATAAGAIWRGEGAKTNPTADGAHAHGQQGVGLGGDPADLDEQVVAGVLAGRAVDGRLERAHRPGPEQLGRRRPAGRPTGPGSPPPARPGTRHRPGEATSSASRIPDSATATTSAGIDPTQAQGPLAVDLEGAEVPLVHPDHPGPGAEGPLELELVVHLDQGGQRQPPGQRRGRTAARRR